jgi:hypothetical protein
MWINSLWLPQDPRGDYAILRASSLLSSLAADLRRYMVGAADAFTYDGTLWPPPGVTEGQLETEVLAYVRAHPETRNFLRIINSAPSFGSGVFLQALMRRSYILALRCAIWDRA